jgi:hypothetical protein
MLTAAYPTTSFVLLAVRRTLSAGWEAYHDEARTMMRMGVGFIAIVAPLQVLIGDLHGLNTAEHQPIKIAAIEAHDLHPAPLATARLYGSLWCLENCDKPRKQAGRVGRFPSAISWKSPIAESSSFGVRCLWKREDWALAAQRRRNRQYDNP